MRLPLPAHMAWPAAKHSAGIRQRHRVLPRHWPRPSPFHPACCVGRSIRRKMRRRYNTRGIKSRKSRKSWRPSTRCRQRRQHCQAQLSCRILLVLRLKVYTLAMHSLHFTRCNQRAACSTCSLRTRPQRAPASRSTLYLALNTCMPHNPEWL